MADGMTRRPVEYYRKIFAEARDLPKTSREESLMDDRFYHGDQLTSEQKEALARRKQPDVVFNRVRPAVNGTLGVVAQTSVAPRAFGRNPQDEQSADLASKALRYIADKVVFDAIKIECTKDYLVPGTMALLVGADEDGNVTADQIRWEEFFYDPRSRRADLADARYMGVAKWTYADTVKHAYPDKVTDIEMLLGGDFGLDSAFEDRPRDVATNWVDKRSARIMLVELYHNDGGWKRCVFTGGAVLEIGASPYLDAKRRPTNPIIAQSCYVDPDNDRYGIVRDMRGPQQEINRRRQKLLHILNSQQVQSIPQQQDIAPLADADTIRAEAARPDGVLPAGWQPVQRSDMATGQFQLLVESKNELERMGPNPAMLGRQGADTSGRALSLRQQAGMTEQAVVFGGMEAWELRVYRAFWERARQFWTAPDWIRVTDDQGAAQFIGINQPIHGEAYIGIDPATGRAAIMRPVLGYENPLAEMDVDIIIETTQDSATLQHEQFLALLDLARSGVAIPPMILLEASSIPNKQAIIEKLKSAGGEPDPMKDIALRGAAAKVGKTEAETALIGAKAAHETIRPQLEAAKLAPQPQPGFPPPGYGREFVAA